MENQISSDIQEQRSKMLLQLSDINQEEYNQKYIGEVLEVLIEEKEGEYIKGHTKNYLKVGIEEKLAQENEIKIVEIKKIEKDILIG